MLQSTFESTMERAGRVLGKLKMSKNGLSDEQFALAAWPVAVGKKIALRTRALQLVRNRLVVEVEDKIWQRQLFTLRYQLIKSLEGILGRVLVEEVEFRVAATKRPPMRAETALPMFADEAEGIRDPILRSIYKAARKKATA
jgi:hypothetical protein